VVSTPKIVAFSFLQERKSATINYSKSFGGHYVAPREAIVPSPDLSYIAFVGRKNGYTTWRLYVLAIKLDSIRDLGKAPPPPPFSKDELQSIQQMIEPGSGRTPNSDWSWEMMQSTESLEPSVCRWTSPHVLRVSYGKDTWKRRATKRVVRVWKL
jgi:hypothetical protein